MTDTITLLFTPFPPDSVKWKAGKVTGDGTKTLGMAYVDARDVMDRLDHAFGPEGWEDYYNVVATDGAVSCTIAVTFKETDDQGNVHYRRVTKQDVGYPNGKNDEEPMKSAYSDALKRACVKLGIGRDLYDIEPLWLPYDKDRKRITGYPTYVVGKGWVAPSDRAAQAVPAAPRLATEAMRVKAFTVATKKGQSKDALKAIGQAVTGKESSKDWTVEDVDKVLGYLGDLKDAE